MYVSVLRMSYRELRNFTEIMRALGYPRLISMDNFRLPNFELVADILYWMVKLYDPETTVSDNIETESDRVEFLTGIASLLVSKARLKLNTRKLYASDGKAVQELLKFATLLYTATKSVTRSHDNDPVPTPIKVQDVKTARVLASEITQSGAKLFDLLANEINERAERLQALRFLDTAAASHEGSREYAYVERSLRELIDQTKQSVEDMKKECEELEADERNIEIKIKKKKEEVERTEKRLKNMENVRPQFMDEVEKLEKELQRQYEIYIDKYRNLDYLENQLEQVHRHEEERMQEHERRMKKMREKLLREEVALMRGGRDDDGKSGDGYGSNRAQVKGDMKGGDSDDDSIDQDSGDSDAASQTRAGNPSGVPGGGRRPIDSDAEDFVDDDDEDSEDDEDEDSEGEFSSGGGSDDDF